MIWSSARINKNTETGEKERVAPCSRAGTETWSPERRPSLLPHCTHFNQGPSMLLFHFFQVHFFTLSSLPTNGPMTVADCFSASTMLRSPLVIYNAIFFPSLPSDFDKTFYTFANSHGKYKNQRTDVGTATLELNVNTLLRLGDMLGW